MRGTAERVRAAASSRGPRHPRSRRGGAAAATTSRPPPTAGVRAAAACSRWAWRRARIGRAAAWVAASAAACSSATAAGGAPRARRVPTVLDAVVGAARQRHPRRRRPTASPADPAAAGSSGPRRRPARFLSVGSRLLHHRSRLFPRAPRHHRRDPRPLLPAVPRDELRQLVVRVCDHGPFTCSTESTFHRARHSSGERVASTSDEASCHTGASTSCDTAFEYAWRAAVRRHHRAQQPVLLALPHSMRCKDVLSRLGRLVRRRLRLNFFDAPEDRELEAPRRPRRALAGARRRLQDVQISARALRFSGHAERSCFRWAPVPDLASCGRGTTRVRSESDGGILFCGVAAFGEHIGSLPPPPTTGRRRRVREARGGLAVAQACCPTRSSHRQQPPAAALGLGRRPRRRRAPGGSLRRATVSPAAWLPTALRRRDGALGVFAVLRFFVAAQPRTAASPTAPQLRIGRGRATPTRPPAIPALSTRRRSRRASLRAPRRSALRVKGVIGASVFALPAGVAAFAPTRWRALVPSHPPLRSGRADRRYRAWMIARVNEATDTDSFGGAWRATFGESDRRLAVGDHRRQVAPRQLPDVHDGHRRAASRANARRCGGGAGRHRVALRSDPLDPAASAAALPRSSLAMLRCTHRVFGVAALLLGRVPRRPRARRARRSPPPRAALGARGARAPRARDDGEGLRPRLAPLHRLHRSLQRTTLLCRSSRRRRPWPASAAASTRRRGGGRRRRRRRREGAADAADAPDADAADAADTATATAPVDRRARCGGWAGDDPRLRDRGGGGARR